MRIVHEDSPVNQRRYGPVWIAKVTAWPIAKPPTLEFGGRVTYDKAEIDAQPGDLCKVGRKDHRGRNTTNEFRVVQDDTTLQPVDADTAREYWLERHPS